MAVQEKTFFKMNGLGNEFVVFDTRSDSEVLSSMEITELASVIDFDQMITLEKSQNKADVFMRIHNSDGSEVDACGNGTRCIGRLLMEEKGTDTAKVETGAGILQVFATNETRRIMVDMGTPKFSWDEIPLARKFQDTTAIDLTYEQENYPILASPSVVNIGNPHAVFWVEDLNSYDISEIGPKLENHSMFPEKANISLAELMGLNKVKLSVWERGAGKTKACGTAACAAGVSAIRKQFRQVSGRQTMIILPGGPLEIEWREADGHVLMTGDTEFEFKGIYNTGTREWKKLEILS